MLDDLSKPQPEMAATLPHKDLSGAHHVHG